MRDPGIRDLANIQCRIGERLSGQGICQICARMQHWGRKWFSLDRSSGCKIPLKKEQECGITGCYQLVLRNFTIKKNLSNAGKYFSKNSMYLLMPPLKETFLKAPSLSYISHPQISNTQTIRGPQFVHVY